MNLNAGKIKDSILEILKDTRLENKEIGVKQNQMKKEEFDSKILLLNYDKEKVQCLLKELIDLKYIRYWDSGGDNGWGYALDDKGIIKTKESSFFKDEMLELLSFTAGLGALVVSIYALF